MTRSLFVTVCCFSLSASMIAQSVGINTTTPHSSAILDVKSNTKGMLIPRTSTTSRNAIVNPAKGLMIYDTTTAGFWFHNGSVWTQLTGGSSGWSLTGNAGTNPATNFIGTTNSQPLRFRVNNIEAGEIHPTNGNVFLGLSSGQANTIGEGNTAIGDHSLFANTEGGFNTAVGNNALPANTTGYNNTALGVYALSNNTIGINNTAIGRNALFANTVGGFNTAMGVDALLANKTGVNNSATGYRALYSNFNGVGNSAYGFQTLTLNNSGSYNTAVGTQTLQSNTFGNNNTATGAVALYANSEGNNNTANGTQALTSNSTGNDNTASGYKSLYFNSTGLRNSAHGVNTLSLNNDGNENTAMGYGALASNYGGSNNTAVGAEALSTNSSGVFNTAVGYFAMTANTTGWYNTAIGDGALSSNTTGDRNIAIGYVSGTHPNTSGIYNTISIGNDGMLNAYQNQAFIGNNSTIFIGGKVNWGVVSDARIKNTIAEDVKGLDFILKLRPVTYHISNQAIVTLTGNKATPDFPGKYDGEKIKYSGFLAQEVEQAAKAANYNFSGYDAPKNEWSLYTIRYAEFVVPLVKAVQEQQALIDKLTNPVAKSQTPTIVSEQQMINDELKTQIALLKNEIELLKKQINSTKK